MGSLMFTTALAEETATNAPTDRVELSFFDYLGALVEDEDGWIDPLSLADEEARVEVLPAEAQAEPSAGSRDDQPVHEGELP